MSKPTARGGQTLVRLKMRNLITRAVFDKTFKAGDKFKEPDLVVVDASYLYSDSSGYNFMDQESFETLTLRPEIVGDDRQLLVDNVLVQIQKFNGNPIGVQFPPHVELTVTYTEPGTEATPRAAAPRSPPRSKRVSRSGCRCSSRKARRSRFTRKRANLQDGPDENIPRDCHDRAAGLRCSARTTRTKSPSSRQAASRPRSSS